jgi:putative ABC transport system permease protein
VDVFSEALDVAGSAGLPANVNFYVPPTGVDPLLIEWALVGIALVLVLFVVAVNLALSAAETRDERDVLTVVGAAPASMRQANGYKAVLFTIMGALLAVPVGFLPVAVFVSADSNNLPLIFPWQVVSALVIVLPIAAGLVTTVASGIALRFRPIRISTMAYD